MIEKIISSKIKKRYPHITEELLKQISSEVKEQCQYLEFGARKIDKILDQLELKYSLLI